MHITYLIIKILHTNGNILLCVQNEEKEEDIEKLNKFDKIVTTIDFNIIGSNFF